VWEEIERKENSVISKRKIIKLEWRYIFCQKHILPIRLKVHVLPIILLAKRVFLALLAKCVKTIREIKIWRLLKSVNCF